jgi:hypothetical protein
MFASFTFASSVRRLIYSHQLVLSHIAEEITKNSTVQDLNLFSWNSGTNQVFVNAFKVKEHKQPGGNNCRCLL